jgi:hypothetical protein
MRDTTTADDGTPLPPPLPLPPKKARRGKIAVELILDKSRRHCTFAKRKAGLMKKAYELSMLTGTQVLLLVASDTGHVYTYATDKLQPLIQNPEGRELIQTCLATPAPVNPATPVNPVNVPPPEACVVADSRPAKTQKTNQPSSAGNGNVGLSPAQLAMMRQQYAAYYASVCCLPWMSGHVPR